MVNDIHYLLRHIGEGADKLADNKNFQRSLLLCTLIVLDRAICYGGRIVDVLNFWKYRIVIIRVED